MRPVDGWTDWTGRSDPVFKTLSNTDTFMFLYMQDSNLFIFIRYMQDRNNLCPNWRMSPNKNTCISIWGCFYVIQLFKSLSIILEIFFWKLIWINRYKSMPYNFSQHQGHLSTTFSQKVYPKIYHSSYFLGTCNRTFGAPCDWI